MAGATSQRAGFFARCEKVGVPPISNPEPTADTAASRRRRREPIRRRMADINPISFGQTTDMLGNAIRGASLENDQIANNLANVNTPNFQRSTTNFKQALAATLGTPAPEDELQLATNDDRQFVIDGAQAPVPFNPQVQVDESDQARVDRSNVDVDQETALLSGNAGYEQTVTGLLQEQYKFLRESITEQPN